MSFNIKLIPKDQRKINEIVEDSLKNIIKEKHKKLPFSLKPKDLFDLLPHGKTKIYEMLNEKIIPAKKIGGKWIIPRDIFLYWYYNIYENNKDEQYKEFINI